MKISSYLMLLVLLLAGLGSHAQNRQTRSEDEEYTENRDSIYGIEFDFSELDPAAVKMKALTRKLARLRAYNDSMMAIIRKRNIKERSDSLEQLYDLLSADTTSAYNAYTFFAGQYHSTLSGLNKSLASLGWPKMPDMSYHYTNFLDFTWKRKRIIQDIYVAQGAGESVTRNDVSVSYSYLSPVNYLFGYCIVDKKRVQFFPFAGLSYQASTLDFANVAVEPFELGQGGYDSLVKAARVNKRGADYEFKKRELILNYGLELDIHLFYSKRRTGFIVGARACSTLPLISQGWMLDGQRYSQLTDANINDYSFSVLVRVYFRRPGQRGTYYLKNAWWEND